MFSMAVLSAMVSIALEMVARVSASFWATALTGSLMGMNFTEGMTSQSMQQGGMGLILTVLIISTPPMAAMFFQGTLGTFSTYSQVSGTHGASQQPLGGGAAPMGAPAASSGQGARVAVDSAVVLMPAHAMPASAPTPAMAGQRGAVERVGP